MSTLDKILGLALLVVAAFTIIGHGMKRTGAHRRKW